MTSACSSSWGRWGGAERWPGPSSASAHPRKPGLWQKGGPEDTHPPGLHPRLIWAILQGLTEPGAQYPPPRAGLAQSRDHRTPPAD